MLGLGLTAVGAELGLGSHLLWGPGTRVGASQGTLLLVQLGYCSAVIFLPVPLPAEGSFLCS